MDGAYKKSKGNAGLEGVQFQLDLLIVFLLNALRNHKDWKISSENQEAGKYDDLVIELTDRSVFLQSKFKQTRKITQDQLFSCNSKNSDFSLPKYFFSYLEIKSEFREKTVIICTNAEVNPKGLENILVAHKAARDSLLHCEGATCSFFTFSENVLLDLKASAEIYFDKNLQGKGINKAAITDNNLKEFLNNLQFFCNYSSGDELHRTIEESLLQLDGLWCKTSHHEVYRKVEDWFKQPKGEYLTEFRSNAMLCEIRSDKFCESLKDFNVSFDRNSFYIIESEGITHVETKEGHLLQILKVYYSLQDNKSRKLYVNPEDTVEVQKQVLAAFSLRRYTFLIIARTAIEDETAEREIISKLKEVLDKDKYKKVILVGDTKCNLAQQFGVENICHIDGSVTFQDFSKDTQQMLLKTKKVIFQGDRVSLEQLLHTQSEKDYTKSLDSSMLERLVRGEEIKVGVRLLDLDEGTARYYVNRRFKTGIDETKNKRSILTETNLYDVKEKMIVISDSAGMGKSTVLTKMAVTIKNNNPSLWVMKINLNDYTRILRDFIKAEKDEICATELLNSLETTKMTDEFEKYVFLMSEKVVLMLDGVDEISPDYTDLVLSLLSHCQEAANLRKIFVTTRPHVDLKLKEVGLFQMQPFTRLEQTDFLTDYWVLNLNLSHNDKEKCKQYAEILIDKVSSWTIPDHYMRNAFTDIPLQVRMLAEIFQENIKGQQSAEWEGCKEYLERDGTEVKLPEKFNIAKLYDTFIEKKRDIFIDKASPSGSAMATPALFNQFEACLAYHRSLAVSVILRANRQLFKYNIVNDDIEVYALKIGIVQRLGSHVDFIHRTFAEYFVAHSIVQELKHQNPDANFQKLLLDELLFFDGFEVVRAFLDILLQKVSLSTDIFKNYRSCASETRLGLIFKFAKEGYVAILRLILESINFKPVNDKKVDVGDWRAIKTLKKNNTLNDLKALTRRGGVNIRNELGDTPLHYAVRKGQTEMIKFLLEQGADANAANNSGRTPLYEAVQTDTLDGIKYVSEYRGTGEVSVALRGVNELDMVELLIERGAVVNAPDCAGRTPLHETSEANKLNLTEYLAQHGADINARENQGRTALHLAANKNLLKVVQCLLDRGANADERDDMGQTALHLAAQRNHLNVVACLVEHGADASLGDVEGRTPLHLAALRGALGAVEYFAGRGVDLNVRDGCGHTPLHFAALRGAYATACYLVEHSEDEDCAVLHFPCHWDKLDVVRCLVECGADVDVENYKQCTALDLAYITKAPDIVEYLMGFSTVLAQVKSSENLKHLNHI